MSGWNRWDEEAARHLVRLYRRSDRLTPAQAAELVELIDAGTPALALHLLRETPQD